MSIQVGELVAVYGSLRDGLGNHRLLTGAPRLDDGIIPDGEFRMVSLGGFPGLLKPNNKDDVTTTIVVEVYEIDSDDRTRRLDMLEGYPSFYNREIVTLEDGRKCWAYFLESRQYHSLPLVEDGNWKNYYETNNNRRR